MKTLTLSTWERYHLTNAIPARAPTMRELSAFLRLVDLLRIDEAERKEVNWVSQPLQTRQGLAVQTHWDRDIDKTIELEDADHEVLKKAFETWKEKPVDHRTLALAEKLGLEV